MARIKYYDSGTWEYADLALQSPLPTGTADGQILVWDNTNSVWSVRPKWQTVFQPVEYIESTGTQYIDTGIVAQADDIWTLDVQFTGNVSIGNFLINGCYATSGGQTTSRMSIGVWQGKFQYACDVTAIEVTATADNNRHTFKLDTLNKKFTIDNTDEYSIGTVYLSELPNIAFCGRLSGNGFENGTSERVFGSTYERNGVLLRNYVPVRNLATNENGLFDTVNLVFYPNAGTGTFTKGADV